MNQKPIKVSVIVPSHNYNAYLKECLASLVTQDYPNVEIIVVDDASEEAVTQTPYWLEYKDKVKFYRVAFRHPCKTRNFGFEKSTGDYILFLDADDYLLPSAISKMVAVLNNNADIGFVYPRHQLVGEKTVLENWSNNQFEFTKGYSFLKTDTAINTVAMVRRKFVGEWDATLPCLQDWDFWLSVCEKGGSGYHIIEKLWCVRIHNQQISVVRTKEERDKAVAHIRKKHNLPYPKAEIMLAIFFGGLCSPVNGLETIGQFNYPKKKIDLLFYDDMQNKDITAQLKAWMEINEEKYASVRLYVNPVKDTFPFLGFHGFVRKCSTNPKLLIECGK